MSNFFQCKYCLALLFLLKYVFCLKFEELIFSESLRQDSFKKLFRKFLRAYLENYSEIHFYCWIFALLLKENERLLFYFFFCTDFFLFNFRFSAKYSNHNSCTWKAHIKHKPTFLYYFLLIYSGLLSLKVIYFFNLFLNFLIYCFNLIF